jgi:hypothetical protein
VDGVTFSGDKKKKTRPEWRVVKKVQAKNAIEVTAFFAL